MKGHKKCTAAHLAILILFVAIGCTSFHKYPSIKDMEESYTWKHFFNNDCGPVKEIYTKSETEAALIYRCSSGKEIVQHTIRYKLEGHVGVWAAALLPRDILYELSNSKCQSSLMYLGIDYVTITFPCAVVHLAVTFNILDRISEGNFTRIHIKPTKVLITYGDGTQEFVVNGENLVPASPFKPFKPSSRKLI